MKMADYAMVLRIEEINNKLDYMIQELQKAKGETPEQPEKKIEEKEKK